MIWSVKLRQDKPRLMSIREILRGFLLGRVSRKLDSIGKGVGTVQLRRAQVGDRWSVDDERIWLKEIEWPLDEQKIDLLRQS